MRHGQSERNIGKDDAKHAGAHSFGSGLRDMDTRLTKLGRNQAREVGHYLSKHYKFDIIFSSPYRRTRQTTKAILACLEPRPKTVFEERIREIEFGVLDGLTTEGVEAQYSNEFKRRKREGKYWYRPPGGESRPDVALRVQSFLGTLVRDYRRKRVLVVCHSVVVLVFRRLLERWGERKYLQVDREADVLNCSITEYRYDDKKNKLLKACYNNIDWEKRHAAK